MTTRKTDGKHSGKPPIPMTMRQLELAADIDTHSPTPQQVGYGHSILTATLYPAVPPAPGTDFVSKRNGSFEYMLEAGVDEETHERDFPYGKYPRLIMAWMAKQIRSAHGHRTDTVDPETRTITIPTINRLCDEMGVGHGGKTAEAVQEQLRRLLAARISVRRRGGFSAQKGNKVSQILYLPFARAIEYTNDERGRAYSGARFILTEDAYERLKLESAPFDTRVSEYLLAGRSVMPYDLYLWLNGSMAGLTHPVTVSWEWLYEQFGDGIASMSRFKATFKRALAKVLEVYPAANVSVPPRGEGVVLKPSLTSVEMRDPKHGLSR